MWPRRGPGGDELGRLSATHGLPSLGERWLGRLVAPGKGLDPEANRSGGAEDQQENNDPGHRWLLPCSWPAGLEGHHYGSRACLGVQCSCMPCTACPCGCRCSAPSPLVKARAQLSAG